MPISTTVPAQAARSFQYDQECSEVSFMPTNLGAYDWSSILWGLRLPGPSAGQLIGAMTNLSNII